VFLYAPTVSVATGATVSALGGAGGAANSPGSGVGGAGGPGRVRIAATAGQCTLSGTFNPPLVSGCAVTAGAGTQNRAYVSEFPL